MKTLTTCYDIADYLRLKIEHPTQEDKEICRQDLLPPPQWVLKACLPTHVLDYFEDEDSLLHNLKLRLSMYERVSLVELMDEKYLYHLLSYAQEMESLGEPEPNINEAVELVYGDVDNY